VPVGDGAVPLRAGFGEPDPAPAGYRLAPLLEPIKSILAAADADSSRIEGVAILGLMNTCGTTCRLTPSEVAGAVRN